MTLTPSEERLILAYVGAIKRYAEWASLAEDVPQAHLDVLMHAESLITLSKLFCKALELPYENG